ncbi:MAG: cohesin domain-containing protein [Candidatus Bathyarchaeota archaeon]|nr:cohesin domain-containing protein [Candidatus Bathyarchaeota archaeon]
MKKLERAVCFLVCLFLSVGIALDCVEPVSAQSSTVIKVESSTASPMVGQTFIVTVRIENVQNLYGIDVTLNWDSSVLQAINVDLRVGVESFADGVLHQSSNSPSLFVGENNLTQSNGQYRLVAVSTSPAPSFNGSGNIVKITFKALRIGSSALSLQSDLSDYPPSGRDPRISLAIDHTIQDSSVTVTAATTTPSNSPSVSEAPSSPPSGEPTTNSPTATAGPSKLGTLEWAAIIALFVVILALIATSSWLLNRRKKS